MNDTVQYWGLKPDELMKLLNTSEGGLSENEAALRKTKIREKQKPWLKDLILFFSQFKSPVTLLLIFGLVISALLGEETDSVIIFVILLVSGILGFVQERSAGKAAEKLRKLVQVKAKVKRAGKIAEVPIDEVALGDICLLEAGDVIPADGLIRVSKDLYVNESALTGESFPVEKNVRDVPADTVLMKRVNSVFKGTNVVSGTAEIIIARNGDESELGKIQVRLEEIPEETAFEKGIRGFGYMLLRIALIIAGAVLIINISTGKPALQSILFALALSLGLTPELLPAIVTITLSRGAKRLSEKKMIVKKLSAIQNLGSIDVLCCDKTGTLTEGEVQVHSCVNAEGEESQEVALFAYLNACFESGYPNPIDVAIKNNLKTDISAYKKSDEVPYDFHRKRLSIVVGQGGRHIMISKGALKNIVGVCSSVKLTPAKTENIDAHKETIEKDFEGFSAKGFRTLGIAIKDVTGDPVINQEDEKDMTFVGYILLNDPPKKNIETVIKSLRDKNVSLKVITGDNDLIAKNIASQVGIPSESVLSGKDLAQMSDRALKNKMNDITIFSETEPSEKERIVRLLQEKGHVVGYLGDGINDASALKQADAGISVDNAVDVAKESADLIMLEKNLDVLSEGITEGRKTYLNTLKYVFITSSANFGNILSMALASLFLPFLPLLPAQILLINLLTDIPALTIASDQVDPELLDTPRKWNIGFIKKFLIVFGLESSFFDMLTFFVLIKIFQSGAEGLRSAWFIESVITEILVLLIIRTRRTFFRSRPGKFLWISSLLVCIVSVYIPYSPFALSLGLRGPGSSTVVAVLIIALLYGVTGELTKKMIFKKLNY